jgi:hypothetical protein
MSARLITAVDPRETCPFFCYADDSVYGQEQGDGNAYPNEVG